MDIWGRIAGAAGQLAADTWTSITLTVWNAGLWVLGVVLRFEDHFLTPDVTETGPGKGVFGYTFWIAAVLAVVLLMVQLGSVAVQRDGRGLARAAVGLGQFGAVWLLSLGYASLVLRACSAVNDALMRVLFGVDSWGAWRPWAGFDVTTITDTVVATVLGVLGLLLWLAAIAHCLVILARAGALIVLTATSPIAAAGLMTESTRVWFWKALRWFHAAAFAPILMTLLMGIGIQTATGVALGNTDTSQAAVGTAVPGVMMILIAAASPAALFKLLAFVDPGTNSGAAVRAGLTAAGGLGGLLTRPAADPGGDTATQTDQTGRSQGETDSDTTTAQRAAAAQADLTDRLGPVGQALGTGLRTVAGVGASAAAVGTDVTNQMGVGHNTYQPDFTSGRPSPNQHTPHPDPPDSDSGNGTSGDEPTDLGPVDPAPAMSIRPLPAAGGAEPTGSGGGSAAETGVASGEAAEAAVLII